MGPTCSPSITRCQPPSAAGAAVASGPPVSPPRTTMMWLHFLQRILKTLPRTFSSAIEYLVPHESQTIFINASIQEGSGCNAPRRIPRSAHAGPSATQELDGPERGPRRPGERQEKGTGKGPHYIEPATGRKPSRAGFPANSEH